ncbi:hypothetical protein M8J76_001539 [Diaphorina citri]|nr:hypothetical protein M8J76_001539 [Diaphorina citri]
MRLMIMSHAILMALGSEDLPEVPGMNYISSKSLAYNYERLLTSGNPPPATHCKQNPWNIIVNRRTENMTFLHRIGTV